MRRVMHRLAHIYHSLSDLSVDFLHGSEIVQPHDYHPSASIISEVSQSLAEERRLFHRLGC